jgi:hypothetical protein
MLFVRLDEAVLARIECASHWVQLRTGLTCFRQAWICFVMSFTAAAAVAMLVPLSVPVSAVMGLIASFATMFCFMTWRWYGDMERHYEEAPDVAHPYTLEWRAKQGASRLMTLFGAPGMVLYGLVHLDAPERFAVTFAAPLCFWCAGLYLQCCVPKPPGAVREFREARERRSIEAAAHVVGTHSPV